MTTKDLKFVAEQIAAAEHYEELADKMDDIQTVEEFMKTLPKYAKEELSRS